MDDDVSKKQAKSPTHASGSYHVAVSPAVDASSSPHPLTVALDVRRGMVSVVTVITVAAIMLLTLFFQHGVQFKTYEGAMSAKDRDELLDRYNGYTGNVATAVGRPLEFVIGALSQFFILRFLAGAILQPEPKWSIGIAAMALSAALGFLLNSGFGALNVQLRDLDADAIIDASDLVNGDVLSQSAMNESAVTSVANSYSELQPHNPVANTVLRNLLYPRVAKSPSQCEFSLLSGRPADDSIDLGIAQRDWMKQLLPRALDATTLRVVINATDATANKDVTPAALPMNASTAADLLVTAALLSDNYIQWGKKSAWAESLAPEIAASLGENETVPTAVGVGLLPPQRDAAELEKRDWFLRAAQTIFTKRPIFATNMSRNDVELEFAHVDFTPTLTSDSLTVTAQVDPRLFATNSTQRMQYTNVDCRTFPGIYTVPRLANDIRPVVHVFSACANDDGTETLQSLPRGSTKYLNDFFVQCPRRSNASLLVLSSSKRLTADSILGNTSANSTALYQSNGSCVATNLRKTHSFTVTRIAWTSQDLAQKFNATCAVAGGCKGLEIGLADGKRLVVGDDGLPLSLLSPLGYDAYYKNVGLNPLPIVAVNEPPVAVLTDSNFGFYGYGDFLLSHNVRNSSTTFPRVRGSGVSCTGNAEDRQQLVLNNHMYMESTLQTSYTATLFFLFQNAVVRDTLSRSNGETTLAFNGNRQRVGMWVSIPTSNALQTCAGCLLLVAGLLAALMWSRRQARTSSDPMQAITSPHVIARVMLDDNMFPATIVQRRVIADSGGHVESAGVDKFYIESLTVKRRDGSGDYTTVRV